MYADRYAPRRGVDAKSLCVAIGVNGAVVAALVMAVPAVREVPVFKPFEVVNIPLDPPPEPLPPEARPQPHQQARATPPKRVDPTPATVPTTGEVFTVPTSPPSTIPLPGPTAGAAAAIEAPPVPPLFVAASVDPAFAGSFQPEYPPSERRAEQEGRVVVRVLIGVDGRVKDVQRVEATSDAFWSVTQRRALSRWRFRPATKDGVPVEQWKTLSVVFRLET